MSKSNKKTMKHTPVYEDVYESDEPERSLVSSHSSESLSETRQVVCHKKSIECDPKQMKNKYKEDVDKNKFPIDMVKVVKKPKEIVNEMVKVMKKPMSEAQSQALLNARLKRSEKFKLIREKDEQDKQAIQLIYEQNMEDNLRKTMIPKYEKQIKKQILERLKDEKLNELKKQYGLKTKKKARPQVESSDSSDSDDEDSEEETPIVIKATRRNSTKYLPPTKKVDSKPSVNVTHMPKRSIFDAYRDMGF